MKANGYVTCVGQATVELTPFKHVIGVDPSAKMLVGARSYVQKLGLTLEGPESAAKPDEAQRFSFIESPAEELGFIEDASIDLVLSGTS